MHVEVNGLHLDVGESLRTHVSDSLEDIKEKYFDHISNATVFFSKERHLFKVDIHMNVGRGILLKSSAEGADAYPAFDGAVTRLGKRLRKYKSKLRDHQNENVATAVQMLAQERTIDAKQEEVEEASSEPLVIADMQTVIEDLTVSDAVMRLELGDLPALMFKNKADGAFNMIYRRADGNIGWVNPQD